MECCRRRSDMLNAIIRFSLQNRLLIVAASAFLVVYGSYVIVQLPIDVLPDINRPVVTIMTESHGLAPEEVERLVTFPLETLLNGATNVERVRSQSAPGLSIIWVEFGWDTNIYIARQIVNERLQLASAELPPEVVPVMGPISSIMGGIHLISLRAEEESISDLDLRTLADWTIRPRILAIPGVAQVVNMGGGVKQYQVLVNPQRMRDLSISLAEVETAIGFSNSATSGGFLNREGQEFLIRNMGRIETLDDLRNTVVALRGSVPVYVRDIARVEFGPQIKRGESAYNGQHAVIMQITKQPGANTLELTERVEAALDEIRAGLPEGVVVDPAVFRQADFISTAVDNVFEALRDASVLVVIVLFLFLLNFRTTTITLTAIPLSFLITAVMMKLFGISINTMMIGGLAIAIGELVDDAIVNVENVFRRLRENRQKSQPESALTVVFRASSEIRNSIVFATLIVILVFLPLFFLSGVEGRLFTPLGIAYVVSILASMLVSLTLTPVLCYYLLGRSKLLERREDGWLIRQLKLGQTLVLAITLEHPWKVMAGALFLVLFAFSFIPSMGRAFLPGFNEGSYTINVLAEPGTSLPRSDQIGRRAEELLLEVEEVVSTGRRTGRAELDEHAEGVHYSEIDVTLREGRPKEEVEADIRERLSQIPNVSVNVGQPISHRIDHILSGTFAQIAVKIFGEDLTVLRSLAEEVEQVMDTVTGVEDLYVEAQQPIPQVRIEVNRIQAARYGLGVGEITEALETALNGRVITQVLEEQSSFDVFLRLDHFWRDNLEFLDDLLVDLPTGGNVPLAQLASIETRTGPNQILRENGLRRIVIQCNVAGGDLGGVVEEIRDRVAAQVEFPEGYFVSYGGQFQSQVEATRLILLLSIISVTAIFVLLYSHFHRASLALQIMLTLPLSFIGAIAAILWSDPDRILSVASLVGFITLLGISARNGIMMISHYLHLMRYEGEIFDKKMIVRGTLERLVPVMMTALTTALGLVPLALSRGVAGKEILYPVAVVILGGLISSTLLNMVVLPPLFFKFGRSASPSDEPRSPELKVEKDVFQVKSATG